MQMAIQMKMDSILVTCSMHQLCQNQSKCKYPFLYFFLFIIYFCYTENYNHFVITIVDMFDTKLIDRSLL